MEESRDRSKGRDIKVATDTHAGGRELILCAKGQGIRIRRMLYRIEKRENNVNTAVVVAVVAVVAGVVADEVVDISEKGNARKCYGGDA